MYTIQQHPTIRASRTGRRLPQNTTASDNRPTTMKLAVFDTELSAFETWQAITSSHEIQIKHGKNVESLKPILTSDTTIVVVDNSIAPLEFVDILERCALDHPQHVFVGTGLNIAVNHIVQLMQSGVSWFFEKPLSRSLIQETLPKLVNFASTLMSELQEYRSLSKLYQSLTVREQEVLNLILEGVSNKESAKQLQISVRTVEARRAKVYNKFDTDNMVGLVRKVERLNQLGHRFGRKKSDGSSPGLQ